MNGISPNHEFSYIYKWKHLPVGGRYQCFAQFDLFCSGVLDQIMNRLQFQTLGGSTGIPTVPSVPGKPATHFIDKDEKLLSAPSVKKGEIFLLILSRIASNVHKC